MNLSHALRLAPQARLALTGAGGKTTALARLARELPPPVYIGATTHLALEQIDSIGRHVVVAGAAQVDALAPADLPGVTVFTGPPQADWRTSGLAGEALEAVRRLAGRAGAPLLLEADGSRQLPLKAPAAHEPAVPPWVDTAVVVVGLSGVGAPLDARQVHRPEIFARLTGLEPGAPVTWEALARYLAHPEGGLKGIPACARRALLLNQADTPELQAAAGALAARLIPTYHAVLIAALAGDRPEGAAFAVTEPVAGIVLAAGASQRLGRPKQTLLWRGEPFVRHAARVALEAGCDPVVVVTGAAADEVGAALRGLPVRLEHNPDWESGQSSSVRAGIAALPPEIGAAFFLLADQPQIPVALLTAELEAHRTSLAPLVAPRVAGRRANPVLFDRATFPELLQLSGDAGGRALFERHAARWIEWDDPALLLDVDTEEDYRRLLALE